jgi:hypothetical protein
VIEHPRKDVQVPKIVRLRFLRLDGRGRVHPHSTLEWSKEDFRNKNLAQDEHPDEHGLFLALKVPKSQLQF